MNKRLYIYLSTCILLIGSITFGQSIKISGKLLDKEEGKPINGGVLYLNPGNQVTTSDQFGDFVFTTNPGLKQLTSHVMGYKPSNVRVEIHSDSMIIINLQVLPIELSEVIIKGDSIKNLVITPQGNFVLTPVALRETPRLFSEPDLLKSFQLLPGVVAGKDGTSDIYVRGGGMGQNIILANGCYFFLPGHLLGIISPYDLDFLESAELYKDYFPAELGGGASSVIKLDFKNPQSDSLRAQLRLGLLSSGITIDLPFKKTNWNLTIGLKRGNYSIYAPLLKKIVSTDVDGFLPPDNYSYYDGFLKLSHSSVKWGNVSYLFFGNYDGGNTENKTKNQNSDTLINYTDGISTGWNNMIHAFQWILPVRNSLKWKFNLNYNRLSMSRSIDTQTEKFLNGTIIDNEKTSNSFSPTINNIGSSLMMTRDEEKLSLSAGISDRIRYFSPNIESNTLRNDKEIVKSFGENTMIIEPAVFISATYLITEKLLLDAGLRISGGLIRDAKFIVPEPRLRLSLNPKGKISPHINYVRLSQFDHSVEGSNAGLRTLLWLPLSKDFGPEISDILSGGFQVQINNNFIWTLDGYYKQTYGMVDFKPGASFIFDSTFVTMIDKINGKTYGLEVGIIKRTGKLSGSVSYTYSRSKRNWGSPYGPIWIPSTSDRPHNFNLALKYYFTPKTSFGLNWVYISGSPATIYMHETSYGQFFETKNNIRYFDYHRLDISFRQLIYKRRFSIFLDADIYNVYNHKNTFYFKETYDPIEKNYYFKNISLFPIMPSLTVTIKY